MAMIEQLTQLKKEVVAKITAAENVKQLNEVRVAYLGKKGPITDLLKGMGKLPAEERPKMGALVNEVRAEVQQIHDVRKAELEEKAIQEQLEKEAIDVTLPGRSVNVGNAHPWAMKWQKVLKLKKITTTLKH